MEIVIVWYSANEREDTPVEGFYRWDDSHCGDSLSFVGTELP